MSSTATYFSGSNLRTETLYDPNIVVATSSTYSHLSTLIMMTLSYTTSSNAGISPNTLLPSSIVPTNTNAVSTTTGNSAVITLLSRDDSVSSSDYHLPYWVILVAVVGSTVLLLGLSFMSVICALALRLKKTSKELRRRQNDTQQHTRQAQESMYMHSLPQHTINHNILPVHNSMIINESYAEGRHHQYNHLTRPVAIPRSHTCHCLNNSTAMVECCTASSSGITAVSYPAIFSMSPSLPNLHQTAIIASSRNSSNRIYDHLYEDPDLFLVPRNYERPISTLPHSQQSINSREQFI